MAILFELHPAWHRHYGVRADDNTDQLNLMFYIGGIFYGSINDIWTTAGAASWDTDYVSIWQVLQQNRREQRL